MSTKTGEFGPSEGVIYKKSDRKEMTLEEHEVCCSLCNGWGEIYHKDDDSVFPCYRCKGHGKLDWVQNARGMVDVGGIAGTTLGYMWGSTGVHRT